MTTSAAEDEGGAGGPERLVTFTDAVAAIAITLLVLPLLELISGEPDPRPAVGTLLGDHIGEFGAFVLSFAVIFRFWWAHHRLFHHVSVVTGPLVWLSGIWTFAIVVLPIPTAIITVYPPSAGTVVLYGVALVLASGSSTLLAVYIHGHPEVSAGRPPGTREEVLGNVTIFVAQILATIVGSALAGTVNYWAFLLIFLTGPVERVVKGRWRRTAA